MSAKGLNGYPHEGGRRFCARLCRALTASALLALWTASSAFAMEIRTPAPTAAREETFFGFDEEVATQAPAAATDPPSAGPPLETLGIETGMVYEDIYFKDAEGKTINLPCWVWIPEGATAHMPLTVFLHGSEQTRGKRNLPMESENPKSSLPLAIRDGVVPLDALCTVLIAPHREKDTYGTEQMIEVIEAAASYYHSDTGKIALTGFSWGGAIAYDLVAMRPNLFCAVFIASSGPERSRPGTVAALARTDAAALPPMITRITRDDRDFPYQGVLEALEPLGEKINILTVEGDHYEAAYASYADPEIQAFLFLSGGTESADAE